MLFRLQLRGALRVLPLWLVIGSLNVGILVGLLAVRAAARHQPLTAGEVTALTWLSVGLYLAVSGTRHRASPFELTLPLAARQLWLVHALTVLFMAAVLGLATALAASAQFRLLRISGGLGIGTLHLAALQASGAMLALALLELPSRHLQRIPFGARSLAWTVLVMAALSVLLGVLPQLGPAGALVPALLAVVVGGLVWRALPPGFTLLSRAPAGPGARETRAPAASALDTSATARARRARHAVHWTMVRSLAGGPKDAIAYPMLLFFGLVLGGALGAWSGDADIDDLRFLYLPMATYLLFALTGPRLATLQRLDPLPIARPRILLWLLLPHLGCLLLGYGAGALVVRRQPASAEPVQLVEWNGELRVQVPVWAQAIARAGAVPEIAVPGGETHRPRALRLWKGARYVMYSPYDTPSGSSPHYVAEQIARAVQALYGAAIPAAEIAARYLEVRPDGSVTPKPGGLQLLADHPELRPRPAGPLFPVFAALAAVPWLLLVAALFRTYRPDIGPVRGQRLVWGFIVVFMLLFIGQGALMVRGIVKPWAPHAVLGITIRHLGETPAGCAAVWLCAAVLLALGYALARAQFRRMEVPATPLRFGLYGCWRDGN
jgi:hypothetical protein